MPQLRSKSMLHVSSYLPTVLCFIDKPRDHVTGDTRK